MMNEAKNEMALVDEFLTKVEARAKNEYGDIGSDYCSDYMVGYLKGFVQSMAKSHPEILEDIEFRLNTFYR
jgi:hypothetical protein